MIVSINWLKRLVDLTASIDEIEQKLTALGLEVEGRSEPGKTYAGVIVGKVLECRPHPDSDHLSITKLFDGTQELQVVCGAPNVAAGQTVAFAPVGTELPLPDGGVLKLKKAKIRGQESWGMICGEDEIGLGSSHEGILVLDDALVAGTPLVDLGFYDVSLEVNVTPNRPDALSHLGIARELAAAYNLPLRIPSPSIVESGVAAAEIIKLQVAENCGCTRYVGRVIEAVKIAPSPAWLQNLLRAVGLTPINNVVDITNFVLLELGQPLHSFDLDRLQNGVISVRAARDKETITAIDHTAYELQSTDLVICDGDVPACVAGVMGGVESEITATTTRVFLESAWFNPTIVRKQSKRLGLSTDSSYRFERHIDPFMQDVASRYACQLIQELAGGQVRVGTVEYTAPDHQKSPRRVSVRLARIAKVVGIEVSANQVRQLLSGIGLVEESCCGGAPAAEAAELTFAIPGFRPDLEREVDLIEEVARLVGFEQIPYAMPRFTAEINQLPVLEQMNRKIRYALSALGLHECLSLRFSSRAVVQKVFGAPRADDPRTNPVALLNPLSEDLGVLPVSLVPTLLQSASVNEKSRASSVRLFEVAKGIFPAEKSSVKDSGFREQHLVAGLIAGAWESDAVSAKPAAADFAALKGVLLTLGRRLRTPLRLAPPEQAEAYLHPYRQAAVYAGEVFLGSCGAIHPAVADSFDLRFETYVFELDLQKLAASVVTPSFVPFSKQVTVTRDVSVEVDEKFTHAQVLAVFAGVKVKNLVEVQLKSTYMGERIGPGKKNLVYQFVYQAPDRTLTDDEVNKAHTRLREFLEKHDAITLR